VVSKLGWLWSLGVLAVCACATTTQYTLKIDGKDPSATQLCTTSGSDPAECKSFTNATLDAPGAFAVVVKNPEPTGTYRLRLQQTVMGSPEHDPAAIAATVFQRLESFAKAYNATTGAPEAAADQKVKSALSTVRDQLVTAGSAKVAAVVQVEVEKLAGKPANVRRPSAADLAPGYQSYLNPKDPTGTPHIVPPEPGEDVILNQTANPYPPPRVVVLERQDVEQLAKLQVKKPELGIATLTLEACKLDSFGTVPYDDKKTPFLDYVKAVKPTKEALAGFLDLDSASLDDLLRIKSEIGTTSLLARVAALRDAANAKIATRLRGEPAVPLKPEEALVISLYDAHRANRDAATCLANVDFVAALAAASTDPALKAAATALSAERAKLVELRDATAPFADVFYSVIDVITRRIIIALSDGARSGDDIQFGVVSLRAGQLQVTLTRETTGEDPRQVADYALEVETNPRFAVSIGPALAFCGSCFRHVTEQVASDVANGKRELVLKTESADYSSALLLHVALLSKGPLTAGVTLGYPVSDASARSKAVLLGVSARHRVGVTFALGAMVFSGTRLKDAYGGADAKSGTTIDTTEPGFAGLTTDSVVETGPDLAFYVNIGLTSDLFQRIK
jgi:hypothetical protein